MGFGGAGGVKSAFGERFVLPPTLPMGMCGVGGGESSALGFTGTSSKLGDQCL